MTEKKRVPLRKGFWTQPASSEEEPHLIGSKCISCGEIFFPRKEKGWCIHCQQKKLEDIELSRRGKIVSFSVVMQQPGGGFYKGPVPYAYGLVSLPEDVMVESLFVENMLDYLAVNGDVELVIERLCDDEEGNEIITFKFKPVKLVQRAKDEKH